MIKNSIFSQSLRHIPRWVRLVQKKRAKNSHAWAPLTEITGCTLRTHDVHISITVLFRILNDFRGTVALVFFTIPTIRNLRLLQIHLILYKVNKKLKLFLCWLHSIGTEWAETTSLVLSFYERLGHRSSLLSNAIQGRFVVITQ